MEDRQASRTQPTVEIPISAPTPSGDKETLMDVDVDVKRDQSNEKESTPPPNKQNSSSSSIKQEYRNRNTETVPTSEKENLLLNPQNASQGQSHAKTQPDQIMESTSEGVCTLSTETVGERTLRPRNTKQKTITYLTSSNKTDSEPELNYGNTMLQWQISFSTDGIPWHWMWRRSFHHSTSIHRVRVAVWTVMVAICVWFISLKSNLVWYIQI